MNILGISGSLRRSSYNTALLRAATSLAPGGMAILLADVSAVPLFNEDVEAEGDPGPVAALKKRVREADALLIACPEYNHSIPGVLKNAIDWLSRPPGRAVLGGKPCGIIGASPGFTGAVRGQAHLRYVLHALTLNVLPQPELLVGGVRDKFDDALALTDAKTAELLRDYLERLASWADRRTVQSQAA